MFSSPKPVIAVVHAGALPGTPAGGATLGELEQVVRSESAIYRDAGAHGIILENMHDVPYLRGGVGPEITAAISSAAALLRFRRHIGADGVQVWADVKKKHSSHAITADVSIGETAHAVEFMRADAVVVTGTATGVQPAEADIGEVRQHCELPLYLGSGITADNLPRYFPLADGFIVGSSFKCDGRWNQPVDRQRVERFMAAHARCA